MAEGQSTEQLAKDLSNQLKIASVDQELNLNPPPHEKPARKRKPRKKKNSQNEVGQTDNSEVVNQTESKQKEEAKQNSTPKKAVNKAIYQKEPKAGHWTREYIAWESQKKTLIEKGVWSDTCLYPMPKKFVDKSDGKEPQPAKPIPVDRKAKDSQNFKANAVTNVLKVNPCTLLDPKLFETGKAKLHEKGNALRAPNAEDHKMIEGGDVAIVNTGLAICSPVTSSSKRQANEKRKPLSQKPPVAVVKVQGTGIADKTGITILDTGSATCTPIASKSQPPIDPAKKPVSVGRKQPDSSNLTESTNDRANILAKQDQNLKAQQKVDSVDGATTSESKTEQKVTSATNEARAKNQPIPEGCVQLVIQTPVAPKPKKNLEKPKKEGAAENAGEDGTKSPSTSSEEEEKRPPPRTIKVIVPKTDLDRYRRSGVLPLKHLNDKFPRAFFHCRLCSHHISSLPETERHLQDARHKRLQAVEQSKQTAALMPFPSKEVTEAIGELVQNLYECSCIDVQELEVRLTALAALQKMIEEAFPSFTIHLYGSTFTGLGLKYSDVNVGLVFTEPNEDPVPGLMIIQILGRLKTSPMWTNVVEDFSCRVPVIRFKHQELGVSFALVTESENACKTSSLLKEYQELDPRFAVLTVAFRTFARICRLDQPDYGSLPPHAFTLMVLYYLQKTKILPVLHRSLDDNTYISAKEFQEKIDAGEWKPVKKTLGDLWLGMLKFYAYKLNYQDLTICVRSFEPVTRSSKNWGTRRLAIEDPYHTNVNVASSMSSTPTYEFFLECMINLFSYFWIPHTADGPLFTQLVLPGEGTESTDLILTPAEAKEKMNQLKKDELKWDFTPDKILRSKQLPLTCSVCNTEGHSKHTCPELKVPPADDLTPPDVRYLALLDQVCFSIFRNFCQSPRDMSIREDIRRELERFIRLEYPDAVLTLFGSSCNGFGFTDSDMDVCMTFESNPDGKDVDFAAIVKKLGKILRRNRMFTDILSITSAKVPIVKMRHRSSRLEADISLYNTLGSRNSQLLATYAAIDPRVRVLGYMAKLLAKQCDIGDASRGTLSSYAYTLMVLHYLQQITPPVIPVLQEITVDGVDRSKYIIEGRDTWFFDDLPNLIRVWPYIGANRSSPSVLWLGFLRFYAEAFNYQQQVVCIRQLKPLYRLEKKWTEKAMAIEDPFNLSHNLASGLSLRLGVYIRKVFVSALRVFQTPIASLPRRYTSLEEYLFNPRILAPCALPPNDRGCSICDRIGHRARDCDRNRKNHNKRRDHDDSDDGAQPSNGENRAQQEANQNGRPAAPKAGQAARNHRGPPFRQHNRPNGQRGDGQAPRSQNWRDPRGPPPAPNKGAPQ